MNDKSAFDAVGALDRETRGIFEGVLKSLDEEADYQIHSIRPRMAWCAFGENYIALDGITQGVSGSVVIRGALHQYYLDDSKDKTKVHWAD